jgi:hypothetical protein
MGPAPYHANFRSFNSVANRVSRTISDETLNRIIQIESAGNPNAKAGTSSAAGLGQFINGTWVATVRKHRPDVAASAGAGLAAMRVGTATAAFQLEMLARFTEDNARALGAGFTDGDLYLAHFLGLGDARKLFRASSETPATAVVSPGAVAANRSILSGKTCGQVRAWAQKSMEQRWAKAGRPDWVGRYAGIGSATAPKPAAKPAATAGGAAAGGAAAGGGAVIVATQQGWDWWQWGVAAAVVVVLGVAAIFAWRWWKARKAREETAGAVGLAAVSDALAEPVPEPSMEAAVASLDPPKSRRKRAPAKPKKRPKPKAKKRAAR